MAGSKIEDWKGTGDFWLITSKVLSYVFLVLLLFAGIACVIEGDMNGPCYCVAVLSVIMVLLTQIPIFIFSVVERMTIMAMLCPLLALIGFILCVPYMLYYELEHTGGSAPFMVMSLAYTAVIPVSMTLGAVFRVIATWGSYLFVLMMIVYMLTTMYSSIKRRAYLSYILISLMFKVFVTVGTVALLYMAMPITVDIMNSLALLFFVGCMFTSAGSVLTSSISSPSVGSSYSADRSARYYSSDNMHDTFKKIAMEMRYSKVRLMEGTISMDGAAMKRLISEIV